MNEDQQKLAAFKDHCFAGYQLAAGAGALVELRLRIFCEAVSGLEPFAYADKLYKAETAIVEWFGDQITPEEADTLKRCRQLRNTVVHCDMEQVRTKLHGFGVEPARGGVIATNIAGLSGAEMLDKLTSGEGAIEVADATSTKQVGVWTWLVELAMAGYLDEAYRVFKRVNEMVDGLLMRAHRIQVAQVKEQHRQAQADAAAAQAQESAQEPEPA